MDAEYSRPATIDDLKTLLKSLDEHRVPYFLIGGYALFAHGYLRATVDIDLLVPAKLETGHAMRAALMVLPDHAAQAIDPEWFAEGATIRVADAFIVDVMFNAGGRTYEDLEAYAETIDLGGIPVKTIQLEGLLLTKQTVRDKDRADRMVIEEALGRSGNNPA